MRDTKFRGKRLDTGEWVYGSLRKYTEPGCEYFYIMPFEHWGSGHEVDRETVGQYTGLPDKNGREIYKGDIVEYRLNNENYSTVGDGGDVVEVVVGEICISPARGTIIKLPNGLYQKDHTDGGDWQTPPDYSHSTPVENARWNVSGSKFRCEIIGNIHENPELLKPKGSEE